MNNKQLIAVFFKLVSISSVSGHEHEFSLILRKLLQPYGTVKTDKYGNVFLRINGTGKPIFFAAHMDTVEPGKNIRPIVKGNYVVSDGKTILAGDNKASIACMLEMLYRLKTRNISHRPIEFIFTRSEEVGNYGAVNFDYSLLESKVGYCFDSVQRIGTIISAAPFYERFDVVIRGRPAHASKPDDAINALKIAVDIISFTKMGRIDNETLFNVGVIQGGSVRNTIPGEVSLRGEIRSFNEKRLTAHREKFKRVVTLVCKKYKASANIEFVRENPGYKLESQQAKTFIKQTSKKISALKIKASISESWGVSDANIFNTKSLLCLNLGDGVEFPHTTRERIKISDMEKLVKLMLQLVKV